MTFLPPTWAPYLPTSTAVNGDTNKYYQYITISGTRIGSAATTSLYPSSLSLTAYGITCGAGTQSGERPERGFHTALRYHDSAFQTVLEYSWNARCAHLRKLSARR